MRLAAFVVAPLPPTGLIEIPFVASGTNGLLDGFITVDQVITSQPPYGPVLSNVSVYVQVESSF